VEKEEYPAAILLIGNDMTCPICLAGLPNAAGTNWSSDGGHDDPRAGCRRSGRDHLLIHGVLEASKRSWRALSLDTPIMVCSSTADQAWARELGRISACFIPSLMTVFRPPWRRPGNQNGVNPVHIQKHLVSGKPFPCRVYIIKVSSGRFALAAGCR